MKPARGFTLLELLVAVGVLALIVVLLNQGVAFGLRAAASQLRAEDRHGDLEAVDRALRQLIAHADPGIFPEPATLHGAAGRFELVTELPNPNGFGRERVEAAVFVAGDQLRLRWTRRRHVTWFGPRPRPQEMALLGGVAGLQVAYFNGGAWQSAWSGERLPALVRVSIRFLDESRHWPPIEARPAREPLAR